jgi:ferredoxin
MENRGETMPAPVPGVAWSTVPGSEIHLITPEESLLVNARFTAESACNGQAAGACVVRIIAGITQLDPASGRDYVEEGHAMERSRRLPAGNYDIRVEYAVTNAATVFKLDDWHFAVEMSK